MSRIAEVFEEATILGIWEILHCQDRFLNSGLAPQSDSERSTQRYDYTMARLYPPFRL
jgi:hypothetical protein